MSAEADHVLLQLTIDSVGPARQGFGVLIILSHTATFPERVRYYGSEAAALVDWAADSPEGRALAAAFDQTPHPALVGVARMTGTVTLRYDLSISTVAVGHTYQVPVKGKGVTDTTAQYTALADLTFVDGDVNTTTDAIAKTAHGMLTGAGPFRLSNTGGALPTATPSLAVDTNYWIIAVDADHFKLATGKANALALTAIDITAATGGGTHTLRRGQNDVIIAQLVQGLNAATGANYTATQVTGAGETDTMRVTATVAGGWFALSATQPDFIAVAQTHAAPTDVTIATDLAAILLADRTWYCAIPIYTSDAYIAAVEAWTESNGRVCAWETNNTECGTTAQSGGTDIGATSFGLAYTRSMGCWYADPALFMAVAEISRWMCTDPGRATPKFKRLAGIVGLTLTDQFKINLRARRMNSYELVGPGLSFFWEGTVFSTVNLYFDITRNGDWLLDEGQGDVLAILVANDIVPFTQAGILSLEGGLHGTGTTAEAQGVLAPGWVVTAPGIGDVSGTDKANRNLSGLKLSGAFAGAIHTAKPINVVLTF